MISKATVVLVTLAAGGAAWAAQEFVYAGWTPPKTVRIKGGVRSARPEVAPAAPAPAPAAGAPAPAPAAGAPGAGTDPKGAKPAAAPAKPEPAKPTAPAVKVRTISDVKLTPAAHAVDLTLPRFREVHVDAEGEMSWHGEGGKSTPYSGYKHLGEDLRKSPDAFVIVPAPETPWLQVRTMLLEAQHNYAWNAFLGVAKAGEPDVLRLLPVPQTERPDEPLPEGAVFGVKMTSREGPVELTVNDRKLAAFPADLAMAWNEWKKEHADLADTSTPAKTRVVFEAPKGATLARVIEVIDVLRGLGIACERIGGALPTRPRK